MLNLAENGTNSLAYFAVEIYLIRLTPGQALSLPTSIRLSWEKLAGKNALTFCAVTKI
jgi:hypothetical protein